jgi:hypothetical protein
LNTQIYFLKNIPFQYYESNNIYNLMMIL